MTTLIRKRRRGSALLAAVALTAGALAYTTFGSASATHTPADKVVAAGSTVEVAAPGQEVTILEASLRTSKPTDLILQIAMECSIITDVTTGPAGPPPPPPEPGEPPPNATSSAEAEGTVRVWVEIDGVIVPVNSTSSPPQDPPAAGDKETDGVTFCNRVHRQEAEDFEEPRDGLDKYRTYLETKAANAFNWLRLNMGNGVHTIEVKADLSTNTMGEVANAEALIGNRSLIVEPAKLANDATI